MKGKVDIAFSKDMYTKFLSEIGTENEPVRALESEDYCKQNKTRLDEFWRCIKDQILVVEVEQAAGYDKVRDTSFNWTVIEYTTTTLIL